QRFDRDDSLAACWQHFIDRKVRRDFSRASEAVKAGGGEDGAVVEAGPEFVDARVDVAADVIDAQMRIERAKLRATARRAGADDTGAQRRDRCSVDMKPRIARIGAFEKTGQHELGADHRRYILEAVYRHVDLAAEERFFQLLHPQPLAAARR